MRDQPRWGLTDIILVYLGILIITSIFSKLSSGIPASFLSGLGNRNVVSFLLTFVVQFITTLGLVYIFAVLIPHGKWQDLGLKSASAELYWKYGVLGGIILVSMVTLFSLIINYLQPNIQPQYYEETLRSVKNLSGFILIFLVGAVLAPLSEELLYRGMIYPLFRHYTGPIAGAVIAGSLFGLAHWDLWRTIPLSLGGMGLCYIYEKSDSILVSTVAHGVWNGILSLAIYFSVFGTK